MDETIKLRRRELAAALRSGEFKQIQDYLRQSKGYCCLGVANELYRRFVGGAWVMLSTPPHVWEFHPPGRDILESRETAGMPSEVAGWFGFKTPEGEISALAEHELDRLAGDNNMMALNDSCFTFTEIADILERTIQAEDEETR